MKKGWGIGGSEKDLEGLVGTAEAITKLFLFPVGRGLPPPSVWGTALERKEGGRFFAE
jgi:hypothetical protein